MANGELKNTQYMNLTNKKEQDKKLGQIRELMKDHIEKYKSAGMDEKDINDYLSLYI